MAIFNSYVSSPEGIDFSLKSIPPQISPIEPTPAPKKLRPSPPWMCRRPAGCHCPGRLGDGGATGQQKISGETAPDGPMIVPRCPNLWWKIP